MKRGPLLATFDSGFRPPYPGTSCAPTASTGSPEGQGQRSAAVARPASSGLRPPRFRAHRPRQLRPARRLQRFRAALANKRQCRASAGTGPVRSQPQLRPGLRPLPRPGNGAAEPLRRHRDRRIARFRPPPNTGRSQLAFRAAPRPICRQAPAHFAEFRAGGITRSAEAMIPGPSRRPGAGGPAGFARQPRPPQGARLRAGVPVRRRAWIRTKALVSGWPRAPPLLRGGGLRARRATVPGSRPCSRFRSGAPPSRRARRPAFLVSLTRGLCHGASMRPRSVSACSPGRRAGRNHPARGRLAQALRTPTAVPARSRASWSRQGRSSSRRPSAVVNWTPIPRRQSSPFDFLPRQVATSRTAPRTRFHDPSTGSCPQHTRWRQGSVIASSSATHGAGRAIGLLHSGRHPDLWDGRVRRRQFAPDDDYPCSTELNFFAGNSYRLAQSSSTHPSPYPAGRPDQRAEPGRYVARGRPLIQQAIGEGHGRRLRAAES